MAVSTAGRRSCGGSDRYDRQYKEEAAPQLGYFFRFSAKNASENAAGLTLALLGKSVAPSYVNGALLCSLRRLGNYPARVPRDLIYQVSV